jgi:hypothetical protein
MPLLTLPLLGEEAAQVLQGAQVAGPDRTFANA